MFGRKRKPIDKPEGFIYIASNQGMPGLIKIGMTYKHPTKRLAELYTTGVPFPFVLEYQCRVPDRRAAERFLHHYFDEKRVTNNREFFTVSANDAAKITHKRVANKKVTYKKPTSKFKRLTLAVLSITIAFLVLYESGHITEAADSRIEQLRSYLGELKSR